MYKLNFDIIIVGCGLVGSALAIGLIKKNFSVAIIEQSKISKIFYKTKPDIRVSAINTASVDFLKKLEVWTNIKKMRLHPYRKLKTWEVNKASVIFSSDLLGLSELGYMIENSVLKTALWNQLNKKKVIIYSSKLDNMIYLNKKWIIKLLDNTEIQTKLVIGADGYDSQVRKISGIKTIHWKYNHSCMLVSIKNKYLSGDVAWQKFTSLGVYAFLPLVGKWASLILYDTPDNIQKLNLLSENNFKKVIRKKFLLNDFYIFDKKSFLLNRLHATSYIKEGLALVGDAAHTINPIAGQGLNLGYKDAKTLINILYESRDNNKNWYTKKNLQKYNDIRYYDNLFMQNSVDLFYSVFRNDIFLIKLMRNFGMFLFEKSNFLKKKLLIYALGIDRL